jgi:NAD(P)-dependent dehydrogenase (short-subunit alcohol dehydrogenase family)
LRPLKSTKGSANARQQPPRAANRSAIAVKHDIGQEYEWRAAIDSTIQEFERLDILVNNPRIGPSKPLLLETMGEAERVRGAAAGPDSFCQDGAVKASHLAR